MNDIFEPVIRKLTQEIAQRLPDIPADLKKPHARPAGTGAAATSAGGGLGIAAGPLGAIAGKVPKAVTSLMGFFTRGKSASPAENDDHKA